MWSGLRGCVVVGGFLFFMWGFVCFFVLFFVCWFELCCLVIEVRCVLFSVICGVVFI